MTNGLVVLVAALSASLSIVVCALILYRGRKTGTESLPKALQAASKPEQTQVAQPKPAPASTLRPAADSARPPASAKPILDESPMRASTVSTSPKTGVLRPAEPIEVQSPLVTEQDRNERILAGISENIRKSLQLRATPSPSPVLYSESKPRNTEYVRVKKEIITPHGHIRFSILKDWMSTNMLAVFRRASLEWKTPEDLIAFLPAYLEPDAEVLNDELLLIGTSGHNEKLAVPMRNLDAPHLRECFDFISGGPAASNNPAVLLPVDAGFEVVSKGVITRSVFSNAVAPAHMGVKMLDEMSAEALQKKYNVALLRMESAMVSDGVTEQRVQ